MWQFIILFVFFYSFSYENLGDLVALSLHHLFKYSYLLMEFIFFGLEGDNLLMIKLISTKNLIIKLGDFLFAETAHIFH